MVLLLKTFFRSPLSIRRMSASHRAACIPLQSADSLSLGSKRSGRIRLQKTQPKRRCFETVCRSLQKDAGRSLLRSIAPGWTGLCGRKVCSRAWCPAIARWADARQKGILNCSVYNSSILLVLFLTNANNSIICQLFSCRYIPHLLQSEYECCHNGRRLVLLQRDCDPLIT